MTSVLSLLEGIPAVSTTGPVDDWFVDIEQSLTHDPQEWTSAIARIGKLSDEHAWSLLGWTEVAAGEVVRRRSREELVTAAFAMSLVLQSDLDPRDCSIVCSLLRRASVLGGLDFTSAVTEGCSRAGALGQEALALLLNAQAKTSSTHNESGSGESFTFTRVPPDFDVKALERWLEDDSP